MDISKKCAVCNDEVSGECRIVSKAFLKDSSVETDINLRKPIQLAHQDCVEVDEDEIEELEEELKNKKKYNKKLKTQKENLKDKLEKTKDELENVKSKLSESQSKYNNKNKEEE